MSYIDGFVLPVPKKNLAPYRRTAKKTSEIWLEYGANFVMLEECETEAVQNGVRFGRTRHTARD